jgi:hypothetical protein
MSYRRPSRLRRVLKWAGLGVCVVIVAAFITSLRWEIGVVAPPGGLTLWLGCIHITDLAQFGQHEWHVDDHGRFAWREVARGPAWIPWSYSLFGFPAVVVPLWILLLIIALPTALLWYRDRRPPKGCCQGCGYNLRGNVSGICPECGESV